MVRYPAISLLALASMVGLPESAGAVAFIRSPNLSGAPQIQCSSSARASSATQATEVYRAAVSLVPLTSFDVKRSAILGGMVSALDRIRQEQQRGTSASQPAPQFAQRATSSSTDDEFSPNDLVPGAGPPAACSQLVWSPPLPPGMANREGGHRISSPRDDYLSSRRLSVSRTSFDRQWERVNRETLSQKFVLRIPALRQHAGTSANFTGLAAVNAWTNRSVRYVEDSKLYGAADYWAGARQTMTRRAGDCEDIAVAKLQLLAALGVPRSDMFLTIARDLVRRSDHAVLIVRMNGRHWMLDNSTDRILPADASYDYQPVLSFSEDRKWLHGAVQTAMK